MLLLFLVQLLMLGLDLDARFYTDVTRNLDQCVSVRRYRVYVYLHSHVQRIHESKCKHGTSGSCYRVAKRRQGLLGDGRHIIEQR